MHDFVSHILRQYFQATSWNEYNSYLHLTSSSSAILDFRVPTGLSLSISASPTPPFFTTYRLGALPNLGAGIGYIYASTREPIDFGKSSRDVRLKEIIERFRIVESPRRPVSVARTKQDECYWLAGQVDLDSTSPAPLRGKEEEGAGEYLIYGCMHVPSARLDALWSRRVTRTTQLIVTAVSTPPKYPLNAIQDAATYTASSSTTAAKSGGPAGSVEKVEASSATLSSSSSANLSTSQTAAAVATATSDLGPPGSTNLQFTLQRDTGRWFTEYSYSVDDALWGFRVLHNFAYPSDPSCLSSNSDAVHSTESVSTSAQTATEVDTDAGGGLRGRFSAGAEVFVSAVEKSAGLSTGIRFSTLPDTPSSWTLPIISPDCTPEKGPSQPPTVITATLNPMMGHLSTAYAARMAKDVVVCSRFDFNVYSYESEWSLGGEYWLRGNTGGLGQSDMVQPVLAETKESTCSRPVIASSPNLSLRDAGSPRTNFSDETAAPDGKTASGSLEPHETLSPPSHLCPAMPPQLVTAPACSAHSKMLSPITGVLKARISTTSDIRLLWQGRLSNCLVSLGVKADLSSTSLSPHSRSTASLHASHGKMGIVKSLGLEVMYFSAPEEID
ncbi:hypothetical protein NDA11_002674 [Ustilago hordei]|uniref:Mitochondrial distribution and morphology protein 10 n=1 Tax=Ustilago hordei TaxID=120017 RepID=I2G5F3_USTHO|nr:uncharacterized protein UHO2_01633 [Ustilago hordei]KAJ1039517.1 hypothetical protein NDA10_006565 [Ustilago hordei]KAJ1586385.1 hypothetical protein NDA12_007459 [Ustilago hordei]KAJ1589341.1 hypothetical protein NDA15_004630 [Ustilago hordei]KAJ1590785.1 hypothetical protein NDA11_002674 [Ustilago hordei]KAJ1600486.1 hypothetical protein NDA14_000780 [Ustilago hordei]